MSCLSSNFHFGTTVRELLPITLVRSIILWERKRQTEMTPEKVRSESKQQHMYLVWHHIRFTVCFLSTLLLLLHLHRFTSSVTFFVQSSAIHSTIFTVFYDYIVQFWQKHPKTLIRSTWPLCTAFWPLTTKKLWLLLCNAKCPMLPCHTTASVLHLSVASIIPSISLPMPSGSQHQAHLAQPGANLSPWLPGREKGREGRKRELEKQRQIDNNRVRRDEKSVKKQNRAYLMVPSSKEQWPATGENAQSLYVCVCV